MTPSILINALNAVSTFLSDKGGITLYPIGIGFPQPTSVKGVYVAGSSVDPRFLTSRFFSPFDGIRISNHPQLQNPISISSPASGATFYGNQIIQAAANQPVTWQVNGVAFSGDSFPASLLSTGRNVLTAVGAESESSIVLNRSAAAGTAFQPEPPTSILIPGGANFTTLNLRFYSLEFGLNNVKLLLRNLTLNEVREVAFTVESGTFQGPTGNAVVNLLPGQYALQLKSADGSQLIVQRDLQVTATGIEAGSLSISPASAAVVSPVNLTISGAAFNTSGVALTLQIGEQPETTIFDPPIEALSNFVFSRTYTSIDFTPHIFRIRSSATNIVLAEQRVTIMPKSKLSISPSSGSWETSVGESCVSLPANLPVTIYVTNSGSNSAFIMNGNFRAAISNLPTLMNFGKYVGSMRGMGHGFVMTGKLELRANLSDTPIIANLPLNLRTETIVVNGEPMLRCSFNSNPQ